MAGVYFCLRTQDGETSATLTGYFRARGEVDVLGLITASIEIYLELTYETASGKAVGRASISVEVSVCMLSFSVSISCEKKFAGSSGDPTFAEVMGTHRWPRPGRPGRGTSTATRSRPEPKGARNMDEDGILTGAAGRLRRRDRPAASHRLRHRTPGRRRNRLPLDEYPGFARWGDVSGQLRLALDVDTAGLQQTFDLVPDPASPRPDADLWRTLFERVLVGDGHFQDLSGTTVARSPRRRWRNSSARRTRPSRSPTRPCGRPRPAAP